MTPNATEVGSSCPLLLLFYSKAWVFLNTRSLRSTSTIGMLSPHIYVISTLRHRMCLCTKYLPALLPNPQLSTWSVKTRRVPSRKCSDTRVYGNKVPAVHDMLHPPHLKTRKQTKRRHSLRKAVHVFSTLSSFLSRRLTTSRWPSSIYSILYSW